MAAHAGLTVERITRAAAELADRVGIEKVTVSALARQFGVKDASFYSHVKNLQEIRIRVALLASDELNQALAAAIAGRSGGEALTAFADAYRDYALAHPGRYAATQLPLE
ncbi:TetR/AcrR family transcriptional regulator, partial [Kitasatospora cineracea]|uniref:TetR/AcrR family transcriptional regulator n=1 Tax=Kitasatospora cineracea TaxID=88074 RepID=UPI0036D8EDC2